MALSHPREPSNKHFNLSNCVGLVFFTASAGGLSYRSLSHFFPFYVAGCTLIALAIKPTLFPFCILQHTGLKLAQVLSFLPAVNIHQVL